MWAGKKPAFSSAAWNETVIAAGTVAKVTMAYYPHSNGLAKQMVQTVQKPIRRIAVNPTTEKDDLLQSIVNAI